jgi:hypothetical protein
MEIPYNIFKILIVLNLVLIINFVSASPNSEYDRGDACILRDNVHGSCKTIYECDYAKQLFRQKQNSEIMNYRCKFHGRMPLVCCPSPVPRIDDDSATEKIVETTEASTTTEQPTTTVSTTEQYRGDEDDYGPDEENEKNEIEIDLEPEVSSTEVPTTTSTTTEAISAANNNVRASGQTKFQKALCENETPDIQLTLNIIGGEKADIGEFPFQAAIGYRKASVGDSMDENPIKYLCGGSLIADDIVISAAHCFGMNQLTPEVVKVGRVRI